MSTVAFSSCLYFNDLTQTHVFTNAMLLFSLFVLFHLPSSVLTRICLEDRDVDYCSNVSEAFFVKKNVHVVMMLDNKAISRKP